MSLPTPTGNTHRVLLLCADEHVRHIAATMLRVLGGHDVLAVSNALQAMTRVRAYRPDVLLLDSSASRATEPATLATLGVGPHGVPLLFLTSETRTVQLEALRALGAHDVVLMPFTSTHLLGRVAAAMAPDPEEGSSAQDPAVRRRTALASAGAAFAAAFAPRPAGAAATRLPLTAATTEGPYYFDAARMRSDITEGLPGVPLEVRLQVVDSAGRPLPRARVDLWHCDAQGRYSGYAAEDGQSLKGRTFLRGHLLTGADGVAAFRTIYPGWYRGRTTHIHVKVLMGERAVLTSQFFLPDALSEFLYTHLPQYRRAALRDTLNSADGIALQAGDTVLGQVREQGDRYVASLQLVVDPQANPVAQRPPRPGEPPPGDFGGPPPQARAAEGDQRLAALIPGQRAR